MRGWHEVRFPASDDLREVAGDRLIRKWYTEFDTELEDDGLKVEREALIEYLLHPLEVLSGSVDDIGLRETKARDAVRDHLRSLQLPGVDATWKVVTVIVNHHRGLNPRINMLSSTQSAEEKTVVQELYKQNE